MDEKILDGVGLLEVLKRLSKKYITCQEVTPEEYDELNHEDKMSNTIWIVDRKEA